MSVCANLPMVFDLFWDAIKQKPVDRGSYLAKSVRMKCVVKSEDDLIQGFHCYSIGSSFGNRYPCEDSDEDLMTWLLKHPYLRKDEYAVVEKVSFLYWPDKDRFEIEVLYTTKLENGYKIAEGIVNVTSLEHKEDVDKFLQMAKEALALRFRPVIVDYSADLLG